MQKTLIEHSVAAGTQSDGRRKHDDHIHFECLMDLCHDNMQSCLSISRNTRGRLVLKKDMVKDDETYQAEFAEQGASACQMAGTRKNGHKYPSTRFVRRSMSQIQHTLRKNMSDALRLLNLSERECPQAWMRLPPRRRPIFWDNLEDRVVPFERNLHGHPPAGLLWERKMLEEVLKQEWRTKYYVESASTYRGSCSCLYPSMSMT